MSKIRFIVDNYLDNTTLSAEPVMDTNLPIDNVKNTSRSKVTRSVNNSDLEIRGIFSSAKDVSGLVIGSHNFVVDMQYQMYLYNDIYTDTRYVNTGGTESTQDIFYIAGNYASVYSAGIDFDVYNDTGYINTCLSGTNNSNSKDEMVVSGDATSIYTPSLLFEYSGDTTAFANRTYTVVSSTFDATNTIIVVDENTNGAIFDGTLYPYARYTVDTGGGTDNITTYTVTGGIDNTDPTNDIFYVSGDQSEIFSRANLITCSGDTNATSNITYVIVSVSYNSGATRTEIVVQEDITGHIFDGNLLPIYTSIPVVSNIITTPNFDGSLLPDYLLWTSGIKTITTETVGSNLWEWGSFSWGVEAWGSDRVIEEYSPPSHIVEWITDYIPQVRGFKIEMYQAGGSTSYFEIGRLIVGKYIQPTYNIGFGHSLSWEEATKQYRTDAGSLRSDIAVPYRKFEFNIGTVTENDRVLLQHELRNVGLRKDLFISLFPEDSSNDKKIDYSGIVKLTKVPKFTEFTQNYYRTKYIMEEV